MAPLRRDILPEDLNLELKTNDFQGSIAVQARQSLEETSWLLDLTERSLSILGVVGRVDLQSPDVRSQLKILARNPTLVGIRHIVQSDLTIASCCNLTSYVESPSWKNSIVPTIF